MPLPALASVSTIHERLRIIYPDGTPNRNYCVREIAAKTIFVMLYVGAIVGTDRWLRPDQVTRMTDVQAARTGEVDRLQWTSDSLKSIRGKTIDRWYAGNTREPIRDETLREGLIRTGAVIEREGLPTTSSKPRYALAPGFAALFDPHLIDEALLDAIGAWQKTNLSSGALARIALLRSRAVASDDGVIITFPNRETRRMGPGLSSEISKAVVEEFAPRFLKIPGVIFLSESGNKVVARDDDLARKIGLKIQSDKNLPDLILVDLGPQHPLLVFVEVVATDGPVGDSRKEALLLLAQEAGFAAPNVAFVTAYRDRSASAFKKTVDALAWGSFAWFMSEPDHILKMTDGSQNAHTLSTLMAPT